MCVHMHERVCVCTHMLVCVPKYNLLSPDLV